MQTRKPTTISAKRCWLKNHVVIPNKQRRKRWSKEDMALMREKYPVLPNKELLVLFSGRNIDDIMGKARRLKLRKQSDPVASLDGFKEVVRDILTSCKDLGITAQWLDRICNTGRYFSEAWRKNPLNLNAVARAIKILGFRLRVDKAFQPVGNESRHLISCIVNFSTEAVPNAPTKRAKEARRHAPGPSLSYPYNGKSRAERSIVEAVSALVPRGMPGRDDVIQDIFVALGEGKTTVETLRINRKDITAFLRSHMRNNFEGSGYAVSIDQPMRNGRSFHDVLAAPAQ
ncbi:MAG: hypothetical protein Q8M24_14680 [Pseudolabrys sp.]|nr:hypothetical protein [Pseudolabrys sp.]MDP2296692.1 hypothetical protein [Pseudolabrys sp.]